MTPTWVGHRRPAFEGESEKPGVCVFPPPGPRPCTVAPFKQAPANADDEGMGEALLIVAAVIAVVVWYGLGLRTARLLYAEFRNRR